jgi:adenine-specific DNA-methyltransferase
MSHSIYKYLQSHFSQQPIAVDKLIISAYFKKNKLTVRNNVFLKKYIIKESNSNDAKKLDEFINLVDKHFTKFNLETLIELFEFVISPADRIVTGAVYTPRNIREYIVSHILSNEQNITRSWKAADIACGCGGFLYTISKYLKAKTQFSYSQIFQNNIFGLDIKRYAIIRTKLLLSALAVSEGEDLKEFNFNLFVGNALDFDWAKHVDHFSKFNCCVGNPPYVCSRKIEQKIKKYLPNYSVCRSGHPDLYIPFFQIGLELLKPNGYLGFITMNSFFKSLNGRALREYFQTNKRSFKIIDFGTLQVFRKKSTYTCICLIQNSTSENVEYCRINAIGQLSSNKKVFNIINYTNLKPKNGWNLQSASLINKIEAVGNPFYKKFKTRNGIATLKNEIYIFKPVREDKSYYWLQNGTLFPIEKNICKEIINPNYLTSQSDISAITEKFIFPYEFVNGKAEIFSEERLREEFPFTYQYFEAKKEVLAMRDKGKGKYSKWFAYGRTQSLEKMRYKLFFPHITPHLPNFIVNTNENLFFYNGIAVIGQNEKELMFLRKLMSSRLFWFYLKSTSKPYTSGYLSMSKNYIKDFGIYEFNAEEIDYIIREEDKQALNIFFESKYDIILPNVQL